MKTIEITYNPYKLITKMLIDGFDVCQNKYYVKFKNFIENEIPLQTWIEPIPYLDWAGFVNEITDPEINDEVKIIFSGRVIDFQDLKRAIADQNEERSERTRVKYHYKHKKILDDKVLSQNIEEVVKELKSDCFRKLVAERTSEMLIGEYRNLESNYKIAKEQEFYIVFAGIYSSGKSTLINTLIRHDVLPTSDQTCTSKNCRIRHDSSLGKRISLACYDKDGKLLSDKEIFDNDLDCAKAFAEICPIREKSTEEKNSHVDMMELGVDLSHLYPKSVNEDKFTIVLIDTPGMDSAQSSEDGRNKHKEIALDAISMKNKPMIVLCADAAKYEDKNIGEFMSEIISQSKEDGSGFNDRFLFLMNKCDGLRYNQGESAEKVKRAFAKYLTDSSKWNIERDEEELKQLADSAANFVPRVFMTAARVAFAIQCKAYDFSDEELNDSDKYDLLEKYDNYKRKICDRKFINFYLSKYCDIPNYRKDEIEAEFKKALDEGDDIRATELQCGIVSVETAIKDYIERYAYPIKVRGLLDTFEDILEDVNGFTNGILADLKNAKKELGEKTSDREEAKGRKKCVEEKSTVLNSAKEEINKQLTDLDYIKFDSVSLKRTISDFRADIELDREIKFIRSNPVVKTGQKTHMEVENEIRSRSFHIRNLFDRTVEKTNIRLNDIKKVHDGQIKEIFDILKTVVTELEKSDVLKQGEYNFTDSVFWKMNFENINSDKFSTDLGKSVVDKTTKTEQIENRKKREWSSLNPFFHPIKRYKAKHMDDYETVIKYVDGYYETTELCKRIDTYYIELERERSNMEETFKQIIENSKKKVRNLVDRVLREVNQFLSDIKTQKEHIETMGDSIEMLNKEIAEYEKMLNWLNDLKEKIKGE